MLHVDWGASNDDEDKKEASVDQNPAEKSELTRHTAGLQLGSSDWHCVTHRAFVETNSRECNNSSLSFQYVNWHIHLRIKGKRGLSKTSPRNSTRAYVTFSLLHFVGQNLKGW